CHADQEGSSRRVPLHRRQADRRVVREAPRYEVRAGHRRGRSAFDQGTRSLHARLPRRGAGHLLAFFELPSQPPMDRDRNTPAWVQHLALECDSMNTLEATKQRLEAAGIEVLGPTDHTIFKSIYFFDPNGHRLELAANTGTPEMIKKLDEVKWDMLDEWAKTKRAPKHAAWMHDGSAETPAR